MEKTSRPNNHYHNTKQKQKRMRSYVLKTIDILNKNSKKFKNILDQNIRDQNKSVSKRKKIN